MSSTGITTPTTTTLSNGTRVASLSRVLVQLAVLTFFVLAAAIMLFPLIIQAGDHVPDWGDPLENAWVLAWDAHQLLQQPLTLYQANIFYPYPNPLAFSESQVSSAVLALPIYLATYNPILSYNFVFFLSFILSGFGAYLLAYDLTSSRWGGIVAGFAFAFWNYRMNHLSHLNLETVQWLPFAFFALRRALVDGRRSISILFAVSFLAQALSSWYSALMTSMGLVLYAAFYLLARRTHIAWRGALWLAAAAIIVVALIVAVGWPYFQVSREMGFTRTLSETEQLSAGFASFISVAHSNALYHGILPESSPDALFPGVVVLVLGVAGFTLGGHLRDRAFWILLIGCFGGLALGPLLRLSSTSTLDLPYRLLYDYVPGFKGTRAPARLFLMGMLGLAVLAAAGIARIEERYGPRARWPALTALVLMGIEYSVLPLGLSYVETGSQVPPVYHWLAGQPAGNVLELPVTVGDVVHITHAMYTSTYHWHSTPLGYASFIPQSEVDLLHIVNTSLGSPTPRLVNLLREFRVRYLVFHTSAYPSDQWVQVQKGLALLDSLQPVFAGAGDVAYEVLGQPPPHPLAFSSLTPSHAQTGSQVTSYVVVEQPRPYPIVNDDQQRHTVDVVWNRGGAPDSSQRFEIKLPPLLHDRPEGIRLDLTAPREAGTYQVTWFVDSEPLAPVDQNSQVQVDDHAPSDDATVPIELVAYQLTKRQVSAGTEFIVTWFWRRTQEVLSDYDVVVKLEDESGREWTTIRRQPVLWTYPPRLWHDEELVADAYAIPVSRNAPAGAYRLTLGLILSGGDAARFTYPDGNVGTLYTVAPVQVVAP